MKTEKFDWRLIAIVVLYMALAAFDFFYFSNALFVDLSKVVVVEIISVIIGTIIAALISKDKLTKCLIGVFVWVASVFTLDFWFIMDGVAGEDSMKKMILFSLVATLVLAVIQLINYGIVALIKKAIKKKP